jgi:hypothetical protein
MLVVTVELWPGGSAWMRRCIAEMSISNTSNLAPVSDYLVEAVEFNPLTGRAPRAAKCLVTARARRQSVWQLLLRACAEVLKAESRSSKVLLGPVGPCGRTQKRQLRLPGRNSRDIGRNSVPVRLCD